MKDKLKNAVLSIGIFYMIVIVVLMTIAYSKVVTSVELSSNDEYKETLNGYKEKISNIKESTCKNYINNYINKVEEDVKREKVNLKNYYENQTSENNLLYYYSKAVENCNSITNEKMHEVNMPMKYLTPSIIGDEIMSKYLYQYELGLGDIKTRDINAANLIPVENNIQILNELQIIEELLNIINWEEEV